MGTIPKLNIRGGEGDVQALNRWADAVTTEFADQRSQVHSSNQKTTTVTNVVNNIIQNPSSIGIKGDGLVHGDAIWEIDPAYVNLREEFVSGNTGTASIGELGWSPSQILQVPFYTDGLSAIYGGEFCWGNSTTVGATGLITLALPATSGTHNGTFPLLGQPSWKMIFVWRFHPASESNGTPINFLKKSVYVGLVGSAQALVDRPMNRPALFIGARFDTDATAPAISDNTIHLEAVANPFSATNARNNTQGTVVDTGIVPKTDTYYRLEITCVAAGVFTMSLNGSAPSTFSIPAITYTAGSGSSVGHIAGNSSEIVTMATTTPGPVEFGGGEVVTFAGFTGTLSALNGPQTVISNRNSNNSSFVIKNSANVSGSQTGFTATGWPSVFPTFEFGNDSSASPATDTMIACNFFAMVWNPRVGGGTGAPDPTKSRFF